MNLTLNENMPSGDSVLKICIFDGQDQIDFKFISHDFDIFDQNDNLLETDLKNNHLCRIKVKEAESSQFEYYLILHESENKEYIKNKTQEYKRKFKNTFYKKVGGNIVKKNHIITNNEKYVCLTGPFQSEEEAKLNAVDTDELNHCRIHKKKIKKEQTVLELFDPDGENVIEFNSTIKIIPKSPTAAFELHHLRIKKNNFHRQIYENLFYQGGLILRIDSNAKLAGINIVRVEDYIKGVLVSEISNNVSLEFAKAMAIVCRSNVYARFGHKHYEESFDFCNDGHCMRYFGKNYAKEVITDAVLETKDLVLSYGDKICNSFYTYSCGGHTDTVDGVWLRDKVEYSKSVFDNGDKNVVLSYDLLNENDVKKWILARPDVYCNLISQRPPASLEDGAASFRWEIFYTREELHSIIKKKTGEDVGLIYEIIPVKRSVSGRLKEIEILGSLKNIYIKGELNIRSALSQSLLKSSCFIVESEMDEDGIPFNFTLIGCGVGHGIGLCKVGAAVMAEKGNRHIEILKHYFSKCHLKRINV